MTTPRWAPTPSSAERPQAAPAKAATASTETARKTTPLIHDGDSAAKATAATKEALAAPLRAVPPKAPLIAIE
jgi:hypothetical protein